MDQVNCNFCKSSNVLSETEYGQRNEWWINYSCGDCGQHLDDVAIHKVSLHETVKDIRGFVCINTLYDGFAVFGDIPSEDYPKEWRGHKIKFIIP